MPPRNTSIKQVQTFPQLVKYLRDELDWPIESDNYDEISWEYDPEELGLKPNEAAKVDYIRQMRPLTDKQPFGIFFVKFSKGRLPVVALRRILSNLVVKRRASANRADRPAWEMNDLLFLSSWGEKEQRHMNFAHFADNDSRRDLPTLKVLDWAQHNTKLHVRDVEQRLRQNLSWPDDTANSDQWRKTWRSAFRLRHRETINTSKALSIRLAELARAIRDRISDALAIETNKGPLTTLMKAFQQGLVHDLDADGFAAMYAQTIAYGLLSARIADPKKKTADDFAAHMRTSPFLRELMESFLAVGGRKGKAGGPGIDFDELGVSDVVELLDDAKMEAVINDFGDRKQQEDPVIHFYELFLNEFDKQLKKSLGVFYTPQSIVSYIVRSVHELLQTEFGLADGLADTTTWSELLKQRKDLKLPPLTDGSDEKRTISPDEPFVQILDPATGTATFLVEVIDVIHNTMTTKWKQQGKKAKAIDTLWNNYVPVHLLPRLHAYELMMAPYAIAHMKVGLKLAETGYRFETKERARIYLTNALEPWQKQLKLPEFDVLAHETAAVNEIKQFKRFTVVIGNPPYSNFGQLNKNPFILGLLDEYKRGLNEKKINLDDDFIKFLRISQYAINLSGVGVCGMITNNVFLDGLTHRKMRESLLNVFDRLWFLNLHGSTKRLEKSPDGSTDENVFEILVGVGISLIVRFLDSDHAQVSYADIWGRRNTKYAALHQESVSQTNWRTLEPTPSNFFFIPKLAAGGDDYRRFEELKNVFEIFGNGIGTDRDELFYGFDDKELTAKIRKFYSPDGLKKPFVEQYRVQDSSSYSLLSRRAATQFSESRIQPCLYRPFDIRWLYYDPKLTSRPAQEVMQHLSESLALLVTRQVSTTDFRHVFVTNTMIDRDPLSLATRERTQAFPLYLHSRDRGLKFGDDRRLNLKSSLIRKLGLALCIGQDEGYSMPSPLTPENVFHFAYAVFHSPGYRERYSEFLKIDFPRLPLTGSLDLFRALAKLGSELTALHLLESSKLRKPITKFIGKKPVVTKVGWMPDDGGTVWLDGKGTAKNFQPGTNGFRPVPEEVWNFHIGGYQVCEKWLKDRGPKKGKPGRTLSRDDIAHYHRIVIALTETIRIMGKIDDVIEQNGGWPGAFTTEPEELRKVADDQGEYTNQGI